MYPYITETAFRAPFGNTISICNSIIIYELLKALVYQNRQQNVFSNLLHTYFEHKAVAISNKRKAGIN